MSLKDKFFKKNPEQQLMSQKFGEVLDIMADRLIKSEKPVQMTICYLDVKYTITCELTDDFREELKNATVVVD